MRRLAHILLMAVMLTAFAPTIASAGEKGWFGFAMAVDVDGGPLSPKLRTIKVDSVSPDSPAAAVGIVAGDLFVEIEGISVAGANAYTVKAAMQKSVGEKLHLKVKHGTDGPRDVIVTAAAKPAN
jgi:C-terminal processing protease CtpA/Prc